MTSYGDLQQLAETKKTIETDERTIRELASCTNTIVFSWNERDVVKRITRSDGPLYDVLVHLLREKIRDGVRDRLVSLRERGVDVDAKLLEHAPVAL